MDTSLQKIKSGEQLRIVRNHVSDYLHKNIKLIPMNISWDSQSLNHVIDIATSIMCTKWEIGYKGGSFAQAVVSNNLSASFGNADVTNRQCIHFYVVMLNNLDYPIELLELDEEIQSL